MMSEHSARAQQYQDALFEALAGDATAIADADPLTMLTGMIQRCRPLAIEDTMAIQVLDVLEPIAGRPDLDAALSEVAARFESPQRFREALHFLRCLERDAATALALLDARGYLEMAVTPSSVDPDLAVDQAALLDGNTFATLWREPERREWLLDTIDIWKRAYVPLYSARHGAYNAEIAEIALGVDALETQVVAVERLNTLERLGPAQAQAALSQYHEIERLFACPSDAENLGGVLETEPVCPYCNYRLGDAAPTADARRVQQAIERGLASQQARLAQRVVSRLLARSERAGSDRLDRFIEVVQASDLVGLAAVLDDGLVTFLEDLLESPPPTASLLGSLGRAFPEINAANLEEAVAEFRQLLQEELQRSNGVVHLRDETPDA